MKKKGFSMLFSKNSLMVSFFVVSLFSGACLAYESEESRSLAEFEQLKTLPLSVKREMMADELNNELQQFRQSGLDENSLVSRLPDGVAQLICTFVVDQELRERDLL